jgi:hypothetical protein
MERKASRQSVRRFYNKPSGAERKESSAEMRHEFDGCYYDNLHKWCTRKATENEACKHGDMAKLRHFSNCYIETNSVLSNRALVQSCVQMWTTQTEPEHNFVTQATRVLLPTKLIT